MSVIFGQNFVYLQLNCCFIQNILIKKEDNRSYHAVIADFGLAAKIPDPLWVCIVETSVNARLNAFLNACDIYIIWSLCYLYLTFFTCLHSCLSFCPLDSVHVSYMSYALRACSFVNVIMHKVNHTLLLLCLIKYSVGCSNCLLLLVN